MFKTLVVLSALASATLATTCPVVTQPRLCGTDSVTINLAECNSTNIDIPDFEPCCRLQSEQPRKCDDPEATTSCRSIEIATGLCPGNSQENCCFRKEMTMKLFLEFQVSNKTCCSKCRCYGDPHCESFDGTPDTWIICDARKPVAARPDRCPMDKATCLSQTDHLGLPCNWTQTNPNQKWDIGMMGSPCIFTNSDTPPMMVMYETDNFKITLNQGERSVIKHILIEDGSNKYVLGAEDCFSAVYSPVQTNPWRTTATVGQTPPTMPADWLPYKWTWGPLDGEDVLWNVDGLKSLVDLTIRCTRTVMVENGRRRYGPPRLNVDIVEPLNWRDIDQRPNSGGFCPDGTITKQGSHAHSDMILQKNWCANDVDQLDIARALCGEGTTGAGVEGCKLRWCTTPAQSKPSRPQSVALDCVKDIASAGWDVTYCATKLLPEPVKASDCSGNSLCRTCVNDIKDFGWKAAIAKYDNGLSGAGECLTRDDLLPDLFGFCTKGVRVQYYMAAIGQWVTQFAIPADACLQDGFVTITTETDAPLFENPMRIIQCSEPKGTCLTNKCATEVGFKAHIELDVQTSEVEKIYNLFEAGLLICDPKIWPDATDCLGFNPEKMCPCPNRRLNDSPKRELRYIPK